jgi:hypothetical protein
LVFQKETKLASNKMAFIRQKVGLKNMFVMDSVGQSGGLALLWSEEVSLEIQNYSRRHIDTNITSPVDGLKWKFIGFYEHSEAYKWHEA